MSQQKITISDEMLMQKEVMDLLKLQRKYRKKKIINVNIKLFFAIWFLIINIFFIIFVFPKFYFFDPRSISEDNEKNGLGITEAPGIVEYNGKYYEYNKDIVNILFIGMDNDVTKITSPEQTVTHGGQADVLILLSMDTRNKTFFLFNIVRDSMTDISVYDTERNYVRNEVVQIAAAHAYGDGGTFSARLTEKAVADLLSGIKIYRYIRFNVNGIIKAADLFGGVTVTLRQDMKILNQTYKAGRRITMDGKQTENYLRQRDMNVLTSSVDRAERHIDFMKALFPQAKNKILKNPLSLFNIYGQLGEYINTNLSPPELNYVLQTINETGFEIDRILSVPGEMKMGEKFAEYIVDRAELYDIIIKAYYLPLS